MKKRYISITFVTLLGIILLFAGSACAAVDFPADEAGISAYVHAKDSISLNNVKPSLATIERETEDYIIGTVALSGYTETQYPHVYVSTDGWVVAYFPNDRPSSWLFPWYSYSGGAIATTTLADTVDTVVDQVGGSSSDLKYYNFKYPDATRMMLIIENEGSNVWTHFKVKIPETFTPYEVAWSFHCYSSKHCGFYLDGISKGSGYGVFGLSSEFEKGVEHKLEVKYGRAGLVLLYDEPSS